MQKTDKTGSHGDDRVELEGNNGAQSDRLADAEVVSMSIYFSPKMIEKIPHLFIHHYPS